MKDYPLEQSVVSTTRSIADDNYNTRQHAFNIGLAYMSVCVVITLCSVVGFTLPLVWLLRGIMAAAVVGVSAFARSLIHFTNEARDIQWERSMPEHERPEVKQDTVAALPRTALPSPNYRNGLLLTTISLSDSQREAIARTAIQHEKLTVHYLTSLGIKREDAERFREELVSHGLLMYNDRHEAVVTKAGRKSFVRVLR